MPSTINANKFISKMNCLGHYLITCEWIVSLKKVRYLLQWWHPLEQHQLIYYWKQVS